MNQIEHQAFEKCIKQVKHIAIINQHYELAAFSRELEKDLSIPSKYDKTSTDWNRVSSLDSFQYYDRIERLINQYSTPKIDESLRLEFKDLHDVIMRPVIRQEMISKILGEDEQQG